MGIWSRIWDKVDLFVPYIAIVVTLGIAAVVVSATPNYDTGVDCADRLSHPAPLATPDREFLERCVHAFTLPTTLAGPTPTQPPTTQPGSTPPPSTSPPTSPPSPSAPTTRPPTASPSSTALPDFPTPATTGVPAGWVPVQTRSTDLRVTTAGAVVQDIRLTNGADILVDAANVTIRRVELLGGRIDLSPGATCNRTRIEQTTIRRPAGTVTVADQEGRITPGGWDADRLHMDGVPEGLRAGDKGTCGTNTITNSFIRVQAPDVCSMPGPNGTITWHGDGFQGFNGGPVTVRNVTIIFQEREGCGGTAPFFYPRNQGNTSVDVDRLLVSGGGYTFRNGMPGTVTGLRIDNNWGYGPIDVRCSVITTWEARIVDMAPDYTFTDVGPRSCNTESGF